MNLKKILIVSSALSVLVFAGCKKPSTTPHRPQLVFKFVFDSTQQELNNFGQAYTMPAGHAGQCPDMNAMSAHYIELAPGDSTQLGQGAVLYQTPMTTTGGASAIEFSDEALTANGGTFFSVALDSVKPGTYKWLRVSLAYQNYVVQLYVDTTISGFTIKQLFPSTIASFIGVNTYIGNCKISPDTSFGVNGNRLQGFWGFETKVDLSYGGYTYNTTLLDTGQAPAGQTTVVNPLFTTSPIPAGSCVVTGQFNGSGGTPLTIRGNETSDVVVTVTLSTNKSFEWVDLVPDHQWEPLKGESIVNMGIRGMMPTVQQ